MPGEDHLGLLLLICNDGEHGYSHFTQISSFFLFFFHLFYIL